MSKITNIIFNGKEHRVSSKFGYRTPIKTSAGDSASFHNGTDYATYGKKIPQYAIEDGIVISCGKDKYNGKFAWIKYPRLNVKMLHYHLDNVACRKNQAVSKGTLIGNTGMTGRATGIHLHLSIVNLANGNYIDPEAFNYIEPSVEPVPNDFLNGKACLQYGDKGANVHALCEFFATQFWGYFGNSKQSAYNKLLGKNGKGDYFGPYLKSWVMEFQKRCKDEGLYDDEIDGRCGKKTLACARHHGFKY